MSQGSAAIRLVIRELWISFRLLVLLVAFVGSGVLVALLPAPPAVVLARLGLGLALATAVAAAVAAWSLAEERVRGRIGWLVTRSVPRAAIVAAWFVGIALIVMPALGAAALLGWLASATPGLGAQPLPFVLTMIGIGGSVLAAVGLGLLIGAVLPPLAAAGVAGLAAAGMGIAPLLLPGLRPILPIAALMSAPGAGSAASPAAPLVPIGVTLLACGAVLAAARLVMERVEL